MDAAGSLILALTIAAALVYAYVGRLLLRRQLEGDAALANRLFGIWWIALAVLQIEALVPIVGGYLGIADLPLYEANTYVTLLTLTVAIWAIVYYFAFLLTGSRRWFLPITILYAFVYAYVTYLAAIPTYTSVVFSDQGARLAPQPQIAPGLVAPFIVAILGPPIVGALGYFRLFFRVEGATQRYRIGLVSVTILLWFASSLVGNALGSGTTSTPMWHIFTSALGLVAALVILAAYQPPRWIRERWGIETVDDGSEPPA